MGCTDNGCIRCRLPEVVPVRKRPFLHKIGVMLAHAHSVIKLFTGQHRVEDVAAFCPAKGGTKGPCI